MLIVLDGSGLGAANEILEYVMTKVIANTNIGSYDNTARDLIANFAGTAVVALVTVFSGGGVMPAAVGNDAESQPSMIRAS